VVVAWLIGVGQSEGPEPVSPWKLRPYERSWWAEHVVGNRTELPYRGVVHAPPEVVMLAPQTLLRNASMAQI